MVLHLVGHRNPVQIPGGDPCLAILAKTARSRFGKRPFSGVYLPYANIWLHRHIKSFLNIETDTQSVSYKVKDTPLRCPALHGQAMPHGQTHSKRSLLKNCSDWSSLTHRGGHTAHSWHCPTIRQAHQSDTAFTAGVLYWQCQAFSPTNPLTLRGFKNVARWPIILQAGKIWGLIISRLHSNDTLFTN